MFVPKISLNSPSYLIHSEIQSSMFNLFNEKTEKTQWLRIPTTGLWSASCLVKLAVRIFSIVEVFFKGLGILFSAPFANQRLTNTKIGLNEIFVHTPKNILNTVFLPIEFIGGLIDILSEPKFFIISMTECLKLNLIHKKADTFGSVEHKEDIYEASGKSYERCLNYQRSKK
jgi:hypothetical protein